MQNKCQREKGVRALLGLCNLVVGYLFDLGENGYLIPLSKFSNWAWEGSIKDLLIVFLDLLDPHLLEPSLLKFLPIELSLNY